MRGGEGGGEGGRVIRQREKSIVGVAVVGWEIKMDQVGHVKGGPCLPGQRGRVEWGGWGGLGLEWVENWVEWGTVGRGGVGRGWDGVWVGVAGVRVVWWWW